MSGQDGSATGTGTVAEEAFKLLGALQDLAAGAEGTAAGTLRDLNEHIATGGAECTYCPLCRLIGAVRGTSPEVRAHLATAASALVDAASGLLATHADQHPGRRRDEAPVEHIDLDESDDWEDD